MTENKQTKNSTYSKNNLTEKTSLKDFYDKLLTEEKKIAKHKEENEKKLLKEILDKRKEAYIAIIEDARKLERAGILSNEELKQKYLDRRIEEQEQANLTSINNYWSYYSKEAEKEREKDKKAKEKAISLSQKYSDLERLKSEKKFAEAEKKDIAQIQEKIKKQKKEIKAEERKGLLTDQIDDFIDALKKLSPVVISEKQRSQGFGISLLEATIKNFDKTITTLGNNLAKGFNQINEAVQSYVKYQLAINTRLQGASSFQEATAILSNVAYSPLINAETLYSNLDNLVKEGIVTNVEQRAFLETIKDGIATTFSVNESYLRRIVRLQQEDSTAARLGLESYLNRFLNEFVENTEYLTSVFDSVADRLYSASALMESASKSTEFEYIVQKWLGTLSGVGLSDEAINAIATAIGQLGSGNIEGLGSSGLQNLLVMATSRTRWNYADILSTGLTAEITNDIMLGLTEYLREIGSSTMSNIVKSQLADVFGITITDLKAVQNLTVQELQSVHKNVMTYTDMYGELGLQMSTLIEREGLSNLINNAIKNFTYQTGMNIASSPVLSATWQIADLIQSVTGGINIPFISALGTGVDLNTTVENLVKLGLVGASTFDAIGDIITGIGSISDGALLLDVLDIASGSTKVERGAGLTTSRSAGAVSTSAYIGTTESEAYKQSALNVAYDEQQAMLETKMEEAEKEDELITFLKEIEFADRFRGISDNIASLVNDGISIKNFNFPAEELVGVTA